MEYFGLLLAILIGVSIGLLGAGGSILTVPLLVYVFQVDPIVATSYSLFVVGFTSLFGVVPHLKKGNLNVKIAVIFGIPSLLGMILTRRYLLPAIPDSFDVFGWEIEKGSAVLFLLATLMIISSLKMIQTKPQSAVIDEEEDQSKARLILIGVGFGIGVLSGLVGVGGGFLIIPALTLLAGVSMKKAMGTSLLIIACNGIIGFFSKVDTESIHIYFLITITLIATIGMILGYFLSTKFSNAKLKRFFGFFIMILAVWIFIMGG